MKVVVIGPNLRDPNSPDFHVHAAGCADIKKNRLYAGHEEANHSYDFDSVQELVKEWYLDILAETGEDWHNYIQEFKFFGCAEGLK